MKRSFKLLALNHATSVYQTIITLAILLHSLHTIIFFALGCALPGFYNLVSVCFYAVMFLTVQRKMLRIAVSCIHLEVCLFAVVCTLNLGGESGFELYLLAISSLVYFCPFEHKFVPYLFSILDVLVFIALRVYVNFFAPYYSHISVVPMTLLCIFNVAACGAVMLLAAYISNISASVTNERLRNENRNLAKMANYDLLTGLNSRRHFLHLLEEFPKDLPIAVAIGDIDDFKLINDNYGHHTGDLILHAVAQRLLQCCSPDTILCRWGGEEFALVLMQSEIGLAIAELESMRQAVEEQPFVTDENSLQVTMTFGVCCGSTNSTFESMIACADGHLYTGKENGKNQVVGLQEEPAVAEIMV